MLQKPLTIAFLGRSGSGKDTQVSLLMERLGVHLYISTGDLMRKLAAQDTLAGKKVAAIFEKEGLPDAWLAYTLWQRELIEKLVRPDQDILFDGTPRRLKEAESLDEVMTWFGRPLAIPILLDVTRQEAARRLQSRGRPDDTDDRIRRRLDWYETDVVPVIEYYRAQGRLVKIDGMPAPEKVFENLLTALGLS